MELRPTTDFAELARGVPAFAPFVLTTAKGRPTIDFKNAEAVRALTAALLQHDFGIEISLPKDRLCPMIPGRLEYVRWIQQVAKTGSSSAETPMVGLDIGTGASAIYPLLCCSISPHTKMVCTDVDDLSFDFARANVVQNGLVNRIVLMKTTLDQPLFDAELFAAAPIFDFSMCNPPFYSSEVEIAASLAAKELDPFAVCTGGNNEMITPGGEVVFVSQMVEESRGKKNRVRWFSSLLGKHSSVAHIVDLLRKHSIDNYAVHEMQQGQTKRWIIAWSHQDIRLPDPLCRSPASVPTKYLPHPNSRKYHPPPGSTYVEVQQLVDRAVQDLDLRVVWVADDEMELAARSVTWSRAARRKQARGEIEQKESSTMVPDVMSFRLSVERDEEDQVQLTGDWTRGLDRAIWDGFWSHFVRRFSDTAREGKESVMDTS